MWQKIRLIHMCVMTLLILLLAQGCAFDSVYHPYWDVSLDAPQGDVTISVGQSLYVRAHSDVTDRPQSMNILVNNVAAVGLTISSQEGNPPLWVGEGWWTPLDQGDYDLFVRMTTSAGETFDSEKVRVRVLRTFPLQAGTPSPGAATPFPFSLMELRADATSLNAGECTFLHWNVAVPQPQSIDLNGQQVPPQGEMQVCPCRTTTYDLIVLAEDKYVQSVTINVTGACVTPSAPPPQREIYFRADPPTVQAGGCTTLSWKNTDVRSTTLNGQPVEWYGSQQVCGLCAPQTYTLEVVWTDGTRATRTVTVNVTGACVTPTSPPPTPIPTPTAFPQASVNFWADATTVPAGSCTAIHWQTENVQAVYFNGQGVAGVGTHQACPNTTCETYTLDVVLRDGSHDIRTLTICISVPQPTQPLPTQPPQDTTPPPVPAPLSPGSGDANHPPTQYCPVTLRWYPVSDPSGVTYHVQLDKRNAAGTWSTIGTWNTTATEYAVPNTALFCDYTDYRWRVRAVDGAGNSSNWSAWFYFVMPIP